MNKLVRVQMLLTDGFGGFGGISRFNRDFLGALNACPYVERVHVLPRLIPEPIDEVVPELIVYERRAAAGRVAFALKVLGKAYWGPHADLVVCGHLNLLPLAWVAARHQRARLVLIIHGCEAWNPSRYRLTNRLVDRIDAFIAVSRYSAERFTHWSNIAVERGFILSNCVDLERFSPGDRDATLVDRYGLRGCRVMLTVGRMACEERYKGFDEIIEVMPRLLQQFPNLRYLIVGDGSDRARLEAKARMLGVADYVIFAGRVSEAEKVPHYNLADVFVMPSYGEGFGIALIEAAACGIPVIGSSVDGSRDALLDGRLGRMVNPTSPEELVEAISSIMSTERPRARNSLIEKFDVRQFQARVSNWTRGQLELAAP